MFGCSCRMEKRICIRVLLLFVVVISSDRPTSFIDDTGVPLADGPFETLIRQDCREWMQRPLCPPDLDHEPSWGELGCVNEVVITLDPSMCFSCDGQVRSVTVWATGRQPLHAQFFVMRCTRSTPTSRPTCRAVAKSSLHKSETQNAGMVRFEEAADRLTFSAGDCLAMALQGVATRVGLPESPASEPTKVMQREVPGVLVFDVTASELDDEVGVLGHAYRGYAIRVQLDVPAATRKLYFPLHDGKAVIHRQGVGLVVRSYMAEIDYLLQLLISCEWFLPLEWPVVVVLDDTAEERAAEAIGALPGWISIEFEAPPHFIDQLEPEIRGQLWAMWSQFWADNYTASEFLVLPDSDSIFHTPGVEKLLFHDGKPVVWAQSQHPLCFSVVDALGLKWVGEFMSYLPFVVHAAHMPLLRDFVQRRFDAASFAEAFVRLHEYIGHGLSWLSMQSLAGAYLYHHHHDDYHWSVFLPDGANLDWAKEDTCPAMRPMTHLGYWQLPDVKLKGNDYRREAHFIIGRGLCVAYSALAMHPEEGPIYMPELYVHDCPQEHDKLIWWMMKVLFSWQTFALKHAHLLNDQPHCRKKADMILELLHYVARTFRNRLRDRQIRRQASSGSHISRLTHTTI